MKNHQRSRSASVARGGKRKVTFGDERQRVVKKPRSSSSVVKHERQHRASKSEKSDEKSDDKTKSKTDQDQSEKDKPKEEILWNEANCDVDLDDQAASNVHFRKIKIANNLILSCKMISHLENKNLHSDYPALVFSRKTNKDKMFNFMVDMRVTERLIKALQIVVDQNPVFFNKKPNPAHSQRD